MKLKKKELVVCLGFFVFSILVLILIPYQIQDRNLTATVSDGIQLTPRSFPYFTAWLIFLMSGLYLALFLRNYLAAKKESGGAPVMEEGEKINFLPILIALGCIYLYVYFLRRLGFILDTLLLTLVMGLYLKSTKLQLLITCIIVPVAVYFIFKLMYVNLPSGILGI